MNLQGLQEAAQQTNQQAAQAEQTRLVAESEKEAQATGIVEYMDWQDDIVARVETCFDIWGVNASKKEVRRDRFADHVRSQFGSDLKTKGVVRGVISGSVGQKSEGLTSSYETDHSNLIHLGEVNPDDPNGRTQGFVEFMIEEGTRPINTSVRRLRNAALTGKGPRLTERTGELTMCGVRVYVGDEDGRNLREEAVFEAPLLTPKMRAEIEAAKQRHENGEPASSNRMVRLVSYYTDAYEDKLTAYKGGPGNSTTVGVNGKAVTIALPPTKTYDDTYEKASEQLHEIEELLNELGVYAAPPVEELDEPSRRNRLRAWFAERHGKRVDRKIGRQEIQEAFYTDLGHVVMEHLYGDEDAELGMIPKTRQQKGAARDLAQADRATEEGLKWVQRAGGVGGEIATKRRDKYDELAQKQLDKLDRLRSKKGREGPFRKAHINATVRRVQHNQRRRNKQGERVNFYQQLEDVATDRLDSGLATDVLPDAQTKEQRTASSRLDEATTATVNQLGDIEQVADKRRQKALERNGKLGKKAARLLLKASRLRNEPEPDIYNYNQ